MNNQHNKRTFQSRGHYTYLPDVSLPYEYRLDTYLYYTEDIDEESYYKLLELVSQTIYDENDEDECWATTIESTGPQSTSEVLFNLYNPYSSYRTRVMNEMMRSEISENPHPIFDHMFIQNKEVKLRIYMGYKKPWTMNILYRPKGKVFQVSFSKM
jgi:hypothetical protein